MKYVGRLASNGKVFDQTKGSKPFTFRLGVGEVIKVCTSCCAPWCWDSISVQTRTCYVIDQSTPAAVSRESVIRQIGVKLMVSGVPQNTDEVLHA